ncbi:MAG: type VI secretion system baseplate subunit TssF [Myxococcota bacterium]
MFRERFQEEIEYLRELGRAMAREYPVLEPFLDGAEGDAAIERILEGAAFLSAQLREKLDDDIPELTHPMLEALAPQLMRPGPAMSLLEFLPQGQLVSEPLRVPAGTEVDSREVEGVSCRFQTAWDVTLLPIGLEDARIEGEVDGPCELVLDFMLATGVKPEDLDLDRIRLFLTGDPEVRSTLYHFLAEAVGDVTIRPEGEGPAAARRLPPDAVRPAGFREDERLWPEAGGLPPAFRLLHEFFTFSEKFWFVDVEGVGNLGLLGDGRKFALRIAFDRPRPPALRASPSDFRLNCTPIVNLFTRKSEAIPLVSGRSEFRVVPVDAEAGRVEVYGVNKVEGWTQGAVERQEFPAFDTLALPGSRTEGAAFFRVRSGASVADRRVDTWISLVDEHQLPANLEVDSGIAELLCTNGDLPAQLGEGEIDRATVTSPPVARFRNIGRVTPGAMPPIDAELPWRLLAQFSLNRHALANASALRWVIASFDLRGLRDRQARRATERWLDGILDVRAVPEDVFSQGIASRGVCIEVELDAACFDGPGEISLFVRLLAELAPMFATENAATRLVAVIQPSGERWESPTRFGRQPVI